MIQRADRGIILGRTKSVFEGGQTMSLTLTLSTETEAKLRRIAAESGTAPETLAVEALERMLADAESKQPLLPKGKVAGTIQQLGSCPTTAESESRRLAREHLS